MPIASAAAMLDFQGRLLERARQICGGWAPLAVRLGVEEHRLWLWAARKARLPEKFFLAAADIVLADDVARAAADRRSQPRVAPAPPASGDGAPSQRTV